MEGDFYLNSKFMGTNLDELGLKSDILKGQAAVVTGGGRGIGKELCLLLSRMGASVIIAEISNDGKVTEDEIIRNGGTGIFIRTDISDEDSVRNMIDKGIMQFGHIDILVNNAIYCPVASIMDMDTSEWDRVIAVNLRGTFLCTKWVLQGMAARNKGTIVTMVSAPSMPYLTAYTCTKQALESFAHSLAGEVEEKNVCVIAYGPGMVETPGGIEAFRGLAEVFGMSYEQFTNNGMNPGYDGLVPAYDSALALAYIIANAKDYHNQTVVMGDVLDKLVIPGTAGGGAEYKISGDMNGKWTELCTRAFQESSSLYEIARVTDEEFNKLPFFARPMARGGFKKKAGISNGDLNELLKNMCGFFKSAASDSNGDTGNRVGEYMNRYSRMGKILQGLCVYYQEVPGETSKFIKDEKVLDDITKQCRDREIACVRLYNTLSEIEKL